MKRLLLFLAAAAAMLSSCLEQGGDILGSDGANVNTDLTSVKTIVSALQTNGYAKSIKESGDAYNVALRTGEKMTVRVAVDGNGPAVGACKGDDGVWYWTLAGEMLEHKVDGRLPQVREDGGNWQVSFDNGDSWSNAGTVLEGTASLFKSLDYDEEKITFGFMDGNELILPRSCPLGVAFDVETLSEWTLTRPWRSGLRLYPLWRMLP